MLCFFLLACEIVIYACFVKAEHACENPETFVGRCGLVVSTFPFHSLIV